VQDAIPDTPHWGDFVMLFARSFAATLALASLTYAVAPSVAHACGGCFNPPGPAPSSVTQHRMALSVSATQTTLWDQFSYSGNPSDFVWILPIRHDPTVRIAVADDRFLAAFDEETAPQLLAPPPPPSPCNTACYDPCPPPAQTFDAGPLLDAAAADSSVIVHREEIVGPYAVAIIGSDDAMALRVWLRDNGYSVSPSVEPILDHYVSLRMDFVAVRLRPSVGLNRMTPIRVTMPGFAPTLPLRMVAAGIGDKVGLQLVVFADSRFEALNYPNDEMRDEDFRFNYAAESYPPDTQGALSNRRRTLMQQNAGRTWLTESAQPYDPRDVRSIAARAERRWISSACPRTDAGVVESDGGSCVEPRATEDATVALAGLGAAVFVTRMSAELPSNALAVDLQLGAQAANAIRSRTYQYGTLVNLPTPPVCAPLNCPTTCNRDVGARGMLGASGQPIRCSIRPSTPAHHDPHTPRVALALAALALATVCARRIRR
jgi:hypothetical protein